MLEVLAFRGTASMSIWNIFEFYDNERNSIDSNTVKQKAWVWLRRVLCLMFRQQRIFQENWFIGDGGVVTDRPQTSVAILAQEPESTVDTFIDRVIHERSERSCQEQKK